MAVANVTSGGTPEGGKLIEKCEMPAQPLTFVL
jgi:hypothetical protein